TPWRSWDRGPHRPPGKASPEKRRSAGRPPDRSVGAKRRRARQLVHRRDRAATGLDWPSLSGIGRSTAGRHEVARGLVHPRAMIRTRGVSPARLAASDLDLAIRFYGEVFGFEVVHRADSHAVLQSPFGHGSVLLTQVSSEWAACPAFGLDLVDPAEVDAAVLLAVAY